MKKKIVVVGSLNMDLVMQAERIPFIGETIKGCNFMMNPGGKGANQAAAIGKLDGDVHMVGCVGNDHYGKLLISNLEKYSVKTTYIKEKDSVSTGIAMIFTDKDGDNAIVLDGGANDLLDEEMVRQVENIILDSDFIVLQLEIPLPIVEYVVGISKKHSKTVILNPAPAVKLSDTLLSNIDIIIPNETECKIITGIHIDSIRDAEKAAEILNDKGVKHVIVTMGENGVFYYNGKDSIHIPAVQVKAVDTTAAGDSFIGSLVTQLAGGKDIQDALAFSVVAAALTVMKRGAQTSLPTLGEVEEFVKKSILS